jgi:hypothetical protein
MDFVNNVHDETTHTVRIHKRKKNGKHTFWSPSCQLVTLENNNIHIFPSPLSLAHVKREAFCEICASSRESGFYQLSSKNDQHKCADTRLMPHETLVASTSPPPTSTFTRKHIQLPNDYETSCNYLSQYYEVMFDDAHCLCKHKDAETGTTVVNHHHLSVRCVVNGERMMEQTPQDKHRDQSIHNIMYMFDTESGQPYEALHCHDDYCVAIFFSEENRDAVTGQLLTPKLSCHVTFPRSGKACPSDTFGGECSISKTYLEDSYFHVDVKGCHDEHSAVLQPQQEQRYRSWIIYPKPEGPFCTGFPPEQP